METTAEKLANMIGDCCQPIVTMHSIVATLDPWIGLVSIAVTIYIGFRVKSLTAKHNRKYRMPQVIIGITDHASELNKLFPRWQSETDAATTNFKKTKEILKSAKTLFDGDQKRTLGETIKKIEKILKLNNVNLAASRKQAYDIYSDLQGCITMLNEYQANNYLE